MQRDTETKIEESDTPKGGYRDNQTDRHKETKCIKQKRHVRQEGVHTGCQTHQPLLAPLSSPPFTQRLEATRVLLPLSRATHSWERQHPHPNREKHASYRRTKNINSLDTSLVMLFCFFIYFVLMILSPHPCNVVLVVSDKLQSC